MPTRGGQPLEDRLLGLSFIEVKGLRIELGGKPLDIVSRDFDFGALVSHAKDQVIEPHDHGDPTGNSVETISQGASRALRAICVRSFFPVGDPA
jgi:hypothetical protein